MNAFPSEQHEQQNGEWNQTFDPGMSLRDYFAAKAMCGVLSGDCSYSTADKLANFAYQLADAMMTEREK